MQILQDDTAMTAIATLRNRGYSSDDVCRALAHAQARHALSARMTGLAEEARIMGHLFVHEGSLAWPASLALSDEGVTAANAYLDSKGELPVPPPLQHRAGHEHEGAYLRAVHASSDARPWREEATDMKDGLGLQVRDLNGGTHVQFVQDGKVLANWYPSKGTTVMGNLRGPLCITGEDVLAWLKAV